MASKIESEIQQHLTQYLDGAIQLHEFEDWFVPVLWDIDESDDERARELAGRVHVLMAEFSRDDRSEESLRMELANAIRPDPAENRYGSPSFLSIPQSNATFARNHAE